MSPADIAGGASTPDEVLQPGTRLSVLALLAAADWAEFAFIRDRLGLSDSALSKQLTALETAGYVVTERRSVDSRRRMRARLTETGRTALQDYVDSLRAIIAG
ncbi:transcriptional regulator [Agromyces archimandritae]|uniref:Transcriptional regulator n=1 Tax=Agromyces archimandritae TaxID=2781962 RepID=A0A975FJZ5_9MICO|nr:transcriptional regulator [Agromyces archimandritae]QTX03430.1 transcriptional regulator [Agromyces archimandritae]